MKTDRVEIDLFATPSYAFFDGAGVLKGLADLAQNDEVRLAIRSTDLFDPVHHAIVFFRLRQGKKTRLVAVDVADRSDYFSRIFLDEVDIYFKRSFSRSAITKALPQDIGARVVPYGLSFPCLWPSAAIPHFIVATKVLRHRLFGVESTSVSRAIAEYLARLRFVHGVRPETEFEGRGRAGDAIILQTRVWPPEPSTDRLEHVNADRIALVRELRSAFGKRFVGGIVADSFSRATCPPELLVAQNTHRAKYAKLVRSAGTGVYVRGLHGAIAIKMAEYLAAGLCVVSEPLLFELPTPLVDGVNYRAFRTPEECVEQCHWLDRHPNEAAEMRRQNTAYYRAHVVPKALVRSIIDRTLSV